MTMAELQAFASQGESESLEFKISTSEKHQALESLCGMLNHRGGVVLFGVEPSGRIVGQTISDRTLEDVSQEIQRIEPTVFPDLERIEVRPGHHVICLNVSASPNRPYTYKNQAYKRVGNTSLKLSRDDYNRMLLERFHGERRWETEIADGWILADLETSEITRTIDEAIRRGRLADPGTRDPMELLLGLALLPCVKRWRMRFVIRIMRSAAVPFPSPCIRIGSKSHRADFFISG